MGDGYRVVILGSAAALYRGETMIARLTPIRLGDAIGVPIPETALREALAMRDVASRAAPTCIECGKPATGGILIPDGLLTRSIDLCDECRASRRASPGPPEAEQGPPRRVNFREWT